MMVVCISIDLVILIKSHLCLDLDVVCLRMLQRIVCRSALYVARAIGSAWRLQQKKFVHPETLFLREVAELHRAKISSVTCHRPDLGADCPMGSDKCNYKLIGSMFNTLLGW